MMRLCRTGFLTPDPRKPDIALMVAREVQNAQQTPVTFMGDCGVISTTVVAGFWETWWPLEEEPGLAVGKHLITKPADRSGSQQEA